MIHTYTHKHTHSAARSNSHRNRHCLCTSTYNAIISYFKLVRKVIVISSLAKLYVVR